MRKMKIISVAILSLGLLVGLLGCGSATNNDQGVSFTLIGWKTEAGGDVLEGLAIPLSSPGADDVFAGGVVAAATVQNNLTDQGIRLVRMYLSYIVAGAEISIPSDSVPVAGVLGPLPGPDGVSSSLPPGFVNIANQADVELTVITAGVRSFLSLNRERLPAPPFTMTVVAYMEGITTAGDTIDTNTLPLFIQVSNDQAISPNPAGTNNQTGADTASTAADSSSAATVDGGGVAADPASSSGEDFENLF